MTSHNFNARAPTPPPPPDKQSDLSAYKRDTVSKETISVFDHSIGLLVKNGFWVYRKTDGHSDTRETINVFLECLIIFAWDCVI